MVSGIRRPYGNLHKNSDNPANIQTNLVSPETRVHAEHFRCLTVWVPLKVIVFWGQW